MGNKLIELMRRPLTSYNRLEIMKAIRESDPFNASSGLEYLDDLTLIKIINTAAASVAHACEEVSQWDDLENRWQNIMGTQAITEGLASLLTNPAMIPFARSLLMVGWTIQKEFRETEDPSLGYPPEVPPLDP